MAHQIPSTRAAAGQDVFLRCRSILDRTHASPTARALARAREAADEGDGHGVADALSDLAMDARFVATLAFELMYRELPAESSRRLDAELPLEPGRAHGYCSSTLVQAWEAASCDRVPSRVARRIVAAVVPEEGSAVLLERLAPLDVLRWEARFDRRARSASAHVCHLAQTGDRAAAFEALRVALEGNPSHAPGAHERSAWASAWAGAGELERRVGHPTR